MTDVSTSDEHAQPMPIPNGRRSIQSLVREDLETREKIGQQRYGTSLQAHNGRDMIRDAYEEAMDLTVYLRGVIEERDGAESVPVVDSELRDRLVAAYREFDPHNDEDIVQRGADAFMAVVAPVLAAKDAYIEKMSARFASPDAAIGEYQQAARVQAEEWTRRLDELAAENTRLREIEKQWNAGLCGAVDVLREQLRARNREYGRASDTIGQLRAELTRVRVKAQQAVIDAVSGAGGRTLVDQLADQVVGYSAEATRLRAELNKAHLFIGEAKLREMGIDPVTEASEQAEICGECRCAAPFHKTWCEGVPATPAEPRVWATNGNEPPRSVAVLYDRQRRNYLCRLPHNWGRWSWFKDPADRFHASQIRGVVWSKVREYDVVRDLVEVVEDQPGDEVSSG